MKIDYTNNQIQSNLIDNSASNTKKISRDIKLTAQHNSDTTEISPESKALANNEILNNLHTGLTLERVKFLLTPRV